MQYTTSQLQLPVVAAAGYWVDVGPWHRMCSAAAAAAWTAAGLTAKMSGYRQQLTAGGMRVGSWS